MQLKIFIKLNVPLTLPISYHHILQAVIYNLMGDANGNAILHDGGEAYGKRNYKLFVFGLLEGLYKIENKKITFFDNVSFEVRAFDENIIKTIEDNVLKNGIRFDNIKYDLVECSRRNTRIINDRLLIKMISPVCVYKTLFDSNHTNYLNPFSPDFSSEINNNFLRKYIAAGKVPAELSVEMPSELSTELRSEASDKELITISPFKVSSRDKYLTNYKNTIIEAYRGIYELSGRPEYLDFLYDTGIGSKNSQGFGMFKIYNA